MSTNTASANDPAASPHAARIAELETELLLHHGRHVHDLLRYQMRAAELAARLDERRLIQEEETKNNPEEKQG